MTSNLWIHRGGWLELVECPRMPYERRRMPFLYPLPVAWRLLDLVGCYQFYYNNLQKRVHTPAALQFPALEYIGSYSDCLQLYSHHSHVFHIELDTAPERAGNLLH